MDGNDSSENQIGDVDSMLEDSGHGDRTETHNSSALIPEKTDRKTTENYNTGQIPIDENPKSPAQQMDQTAGKKNVVIPTSTNHAEYHIIASMIQYIGLQVKHASFSLENFEKDPAEYVKMLGFCQLQVNSHFDKLQAKFEVIVNNARFELAFENFKNSVKQIMTTIDSKTTPSEEMRVNFEKQVKDCLATLVETGTNSARGEVAMDQSAMPFAQEKDMVLEQPVDLDNTAIQDEAQRDLGSNNAIEDTFLGDGNGGADTPIPSTLGNSSPNFTLPNSPKNQIEPGSPQIASNLVPSTSGLSDAASQSPRNVPSSSTSVQRRTSEDPRPAPLSTKNELGKRQQDQPPARTEEVSSQAKRSKPNQNGNPDPLPNSEPQNFAAEDSQISSGNGEVDFKPYVEEMEKRTMIGEDCEAESQAQYTLMVLMSVIELPGDEYTDEEKQWLTEKLVEISEMEQEKYVPREVHQHTFPSTVDKGNYRMLNDFFEKNVYPEPTKLVQQTEDNGSSAGTSEESTAKGNKTTEIPASSGTDKRLPMEFRERLTGEIYIDVFANTAKQIRQVASEGFKQTPRENRIYSTGKKAGLPKKNREMYDAQLQHNKEKHGYTGHDGLDKNSAEYLLAPVNRLFVTDDTDLDDPNFVAAATEQDLTIIEGMMEKCNMDASKFRKEEVLEADKTTYAAVINVLCEQPQYINSNKDFRTGKQKFIYTFPEKKVPLKEYNEFIDDVIEAGKKGLKRVLEEGENATYKDFRDTTAQLLKVQRKHKVLPAASQRPLCTFFGTNIDLDDEEKYDKQISEAGKVPMWMRPNGPLCLLQNIGKPILGMNSIQMYLKSVLNRTAAHIENAAMGSANLNTGDSESVWMSVSYEWAGHIRALADRLLKEGEERMEFWLFEQKLRECGIPVQIGIQKKGDLVIVAPGTYHWVQSRGFTSQIAWNFGRHTLTQLRTMTLQYDFLLEIQRKNIVPVTKICWELARKKEFCDKSGDLECYKVIKTVLARYLAYLTFQLETLEEEGTEVLPMDEKCGIEPYVICRTCKNSISMLVFHAREETYHYCFNHRQDHHTAWLRWTVETLDKFFDEYIRKTD